jgi:demethylmenaquinone methyltransferase/2-methoxy-6-polyprenyl-1,4-benzoquinol methylase
VSSGQHVCDLGTGTGDLALAFADALGRDGIVVGADLSAGMLHEAGSKLREAGHGTVHLVRASAAASGLPDGWAQAVCMGWVLRNVGDRQEVYREIRRLLEPGGRFVTIDMSRPRGRLARCGFWIYRHAVMPVMIRLLGGDFQAYRYLAASTDRFPDAPDLEAELATAGFHDVHHVPLMGGAVAIHVGTR